MKLDQTIDREINKRLVAVNDLRNKLHQSSGKLSAGKLGDPVLWNVLHTLGVPKKKLEPYVLRKFARGDDVEEWLVQYIPGLIAKQFFIQYRDVVGYADGVVDTSGWDFKNGTIPLEIKSVTNASFKWMIKAKGPKTHHALQAACYALGMGVKHAVLAYVASDDYRVKCYVIDVKDYKAEVDNAIDEYNKAMKDWEEKQVLPEFKARQEWQKNPKYSPYPAFYDKPGQVMAQEVIRFLVEGGDKK